MFITRLTIQGFACYRDETVLADFSNGHNLILGSNGSGKSNIFLAIRFLLSEEFSRLTKEQRLQILFNGDGAYAVSAFVEIVFDNSSHRFPAKETEVVLRRTLGQEKDVITLNGKTCIRREVDDLLDGAGLARTNQYFIVQQGKVSAIARMKASERLELLEQVAGTKAYEDRRAESAKLMAETDLKVEKITEVLESIRQRLEELEGEKEELKEFQELDRKKRSLEFTLYDRELNDARNALDNLDHARSSESSTSRELHGKALSIRNEIEKAEAACKDLTDRIEAWERSRELLEDDRQLAMALRTKCELDVKELQEKLHSDRKKRVTVFDEMKELNGRIESSKKELKQLIPALEKTQSEESRLTGELAVVRERIDALHEKQGRGAMFESREARDEWISTELATLDGHIEERLRQRASLSSGVEKDAELVRKCESDRKEQQNALEQRRSAIERSSKLLHELKVKRSSLHDERKRLWKREGDLTSELEFSTRALNKAERHLQQGVSREVWRGVEALGALAVELGCVDDVFGPVFELVRCEPAFDVAVEIAAGNRLFHIVVSTDEVASKLLEQMTAKQLGRVTLIPLNVVSGFSASRKAKVGAVSQLPRNEDVFPLLDKLQFEERFRPVIMQVFGNTLVCRNLEIASTFSLQYGCNGITLGGDEVNRRGALTGGHYEIQHLRLESARRVREHAQTIATLSSEKAVIVKDLAACDAKIDGVLSRLEKAEADRAQLQESSMQFRLDVLSHSESLARWTAQKKVKERALGDLDVSIQSLRESQAALRAELGTPLTAKISEEEQEELKECNTRATGVRRKLSELAEQHVSQETRRNSLETELLSNLSRRKEELRDSAHALAIDETENALLFAQQDLDRQTADLERLVAEAQSASFEVESKQRLLNDATEIIESKSAEESLIQTQILEESKKLDRVMNRRSVFLQKKEEAMNKIREIGSLPADALERTEGVSSRTLVRQLHEVNEELKRFQHVNKKALEQFVTFTEQRDELNARAAEQKKGAESIRKLIAHLDMQKEEAIVRTFKDVSIHFETVFEELVPTGKGNLTIATEEDEEEEGTRAVASHLKSFVGVVPRVSFTSKDESAPSADLHALSGGQKAVVSLALILAIQRCNPAPFYLFDEIDQALDVTHRQAVAALVERESVNAQFLTTTFRPELVGVADRFFLVSHDGKASQVRPGTREDAIQLVMTAERPSTPAEIPVIQTVSTSIPTDVIPM